MLETPSISRSIQEVEHIIASLDAAQTISATDVISALRTGSCGAGLEDVVSQFLSCAGADLIVQMSINSKEGTDPLGAVTLVARLAERVRCDRASTIEVELRRALIPKDFPIQPKNVAIGGAQPKVALSRFGGKFYEPGTSPPEVLERWDILEDLARQLGEKCLLNEHGKYAHLSRPEIIRQYQERLQRMGWGSNAEMIWVIHRTAAMIAWDLPREAIP